MAIKFSAVGSFITDITKIAQNPDKYSLKDDEINRLAEILTEIDNLHYRTELEPNTEFNGANVSLVITREFIDNSRNPLRSAELFGQIHDVIGKHYIPVDAYVRLGQACNELGVEGMMSPDIKIAIKEAGRKQAGRLAGFQYGSMNPLDYATEFNPNAAIRVFKERELRGGRPEAEEDYGY